MRRSARLFVPMMLILGYYAVVVAATIMFVKRFPELVSFLPLGGLGDLASYPQLDFEPVHTSVENTVLDPDGPIRLALATLGSLIVIIPVSWAYFITSRSTRLDQSFVQTIIILPVVVTGIAMIVMNSIALAFSLAGIVAAVRFRFSLAIPSDAMYIFVAIAIGLGSGIGAVAASFVISLAFVMTTLVIWRLEYGKTLSGPWLRMVARRDSSDDDY
ncbi:MAG: DUF4956 domain-containing protein [Pseudomonadota bacterium]